MLQARSISKSVAFRPLFREISLTIAPGDRLGIVGPNGSGKSTLLRILSRMDAPDGGEIVADDRMRAVVVPQDESFEPGRRPRDLVTAAGMEGARARSEPVEPHEAEIRASIVLGKTGFPDQLADADAGTLSGGWRKRLSIAIALAHAQDEPDLLLLDEPTNHLDLSGIRWLEDLVNRVGNRRSGAGVAFITHDRDFLERVCTRVAEISPLYPSGILAVDGNYSEFLRRKQEALEAHAARQRYLAGQVRKDLDWLSRGPQGRGTKAKGRIDRSYARMDELSDLRDRAAEGERGGSRVDFNASGRKTRKMIVAKGVSKTLGGKRLFTDVSLRLGAGDRLGLLGPNGSGKTTLIRVLTGQLEPDEGEVVMASPKPTIAVFSQHRREFPRETRLREALCPVGDHVTFRGRSIHVTGWARRFLFRDGQLEQPMGSLSGGELARVHVARIMLEPSDVLVLDEPTNDLDIPTLETLEEALEDYPGALVLVTHDRAMLDRLATEVLALDGAGGAEAFASVEQAIAAADRRRADAIAAIKKASPSPAPPRPARAKKLSYREQQEYDRIESDIQHAESAAAAAEARTLDPKVIADHVAMHDACDTLREAQARVAALYERWDYLEQRRAGEIPPASG
ncbi:MAG: ABC-F family ATP-binding cassette domain-containing protein [Phycisphaerales bacterium]